MNNLLVTMAIGEKYYSQYKNLFYPSQLYYAQKYNYDFKIVTDRPPETIDHPDTVSFDKILLFDQEWSFNYKHVIFIDADIFINPNSPPIHNFIDNNHIGIIDEWSQPTPEKRIQIQSLMGWETSCKEYYALAGFDLDTTIGINTGVIVANPRIHGSFFRNIHRSYNKYSINNPRHFHFEQSAIGYSIQKSNEAQYLDNRFNAIYAIHKIYNRNLTISEFTKDNYFIHLAGKYEFDKVNHLNKEYKLL
jgi:hypothetical protein